MWIVDTLPKTGTLLLYYRSSLQFTNELPAKCECQWFCCAASELKYGRFRSVISFKINFCC